MAPGSTDLLTLAEAQSALNDTEVDAGDNAEIEAYIAAVSRFLDWMYGPIIERTVTGEIHDGDMCAIWLRESPVSSVTSVTVNGTTLTAGVDYYAEPSAHRSGLLSGQVTSLEGGLRGGMFEYGTDSVGAVSVTYTAGRFADRDAVDGRFRQAAVLTLQHAFRAEQRTVFQDSQGFATPTSGYPKDWDLRAVRSILMGERRRRGIGVA